MSQKTQVIKVVLIAPTRAASKAAVKHLEETFRHGYKHRHRKKGDKGDILAYGELELEPKG